MSTETVVWLAVTAVRLLVPLSVLRWPLGGAIACIVADVYDHTIFRSTGFGPLGAEHYQQWDKLMDTWYLAFLFVVSRRWTSALARRTMTALFAWRVVGVALLEATGWRPILVLAPNIFENFYLFWTVALKWFPFKLTGRRLALILIAVGIPKLYQEASMHWLAPDQPVGTPLLNLFEKFR